MRKRGSQMHLVMSDCYEKLVPPDHFLRNLDKALDFGFVENLCRDKYRVVDGGPGRAAEPPVRLFKLLLLMFLYQVKFERELERRANDTISWRWFCAYAPDDPVASHKTMWLFRNRLGPEVFDAAFAEVLKRCIDSGLVDNKRWHVDATKQDAAATRFSQHDVAVILTQAMVARIRENAGADEVDTGAPPVEMDDDMKLLVAKAACEAARLKTSNPRRVLAKSEAREYVPVEEKEDTCDPTDPEPDPRLSELKSMAVEMEKNLAPCAGDKDARIGRTPSISNFCGYISTVVVDEKHGVALGYETFAGNVDQTKTFQGPYSDARLSCGKPDELVADSGFDHLDIRKLVVKDGVAGYISMMKPRGRTAVYGSDRFKVTKDGDRYRVECPAHRFMRDLGGTREGYRIFRGEECSECGLRERCTADKNGSRKFQFNPEFRVFQEKQWLLRKTEEYKRAMKARMATIEPVFGHAKTYHNLGKCIYRSKPMNAIQTTMSLLTVNLEKLMRYGHKPQEAQYGY